MDYELLVDVDKECVKLCEAINRIPNIHTIESCCGHGKELYRVWFKCDTLDFLPILLYYIVPCHTGFIHWDCFVKTDCVMQYPTFCLQSQDMGQIAYDESEEIADLINGYFDKVEKNKNWKEGSLGWLLRRGTGL